MKNLIFILLFLFACDHPYSKDCYMFSQNRTIEYKQGQTLNIYSEFRVCEIDITIANKVCNELTNIDTLKENGQITGIIKTIVTIKKEKNWDK
jgi:hypothetical protein